VSDKAGVYDKTGERELTTDDMYCSGSVSKMFTAAAVLSSGGSIEFINEGDVEYILYSDYKAIKMTDIPQIYSGSNSICTIRPDGETRWYSADPALAGKTIRAEAPENASFFVYDMDTGACVANSYAFGNNEAEIPQNAMLGFAGEAGARFVITVR
jgi:hypothetical protein